MTLDENIFRGGIVLEDGSTVDITSSCGVTVAAAGCQTCPGDLEGPPGDGWVTTNDYSLMLDALANAPGNYFQITPGVDDCYDMEPDGWATTNDLALLLDALANAPGNYYQCPE
jgi:hypothetical protein